MNWPFGISKVIFFILHRTRSATTRQTMSEDSFSAEDQRILYQPEFTALDRACHSSTLFSLTLIINLELVEAFASSKGDKFSFMGMVDVIAKKGNEKKILCIGNYRLYLLKVAKKKVEVSK